MTDIWTSASVVSNDGGYQERFDAALDAATAALAPKFAFVIEATTKASFNDRIDIVARDIEKVITAATRSDPTLFAPVHEAVTMQWEMDFDAINEHRASETQREGNKRGWWRKKRREAAGTKMCQYCGKRISFGDYGGQWTDTTGGTDCAKSNVGHKPGVKESGKTAVQGGPPHEYVGSGERCRQCGFTRNHIVHQPSKTAGLGYSPGAPSYFTADFDKLSQALSDGGWVMTLDDGFQAIDPSAPAELVRAYNGLLQVGYANGYIASKKTGSMLKGAPFAGYTDFDDCLAKNADKQDPAAYCGAIKHKVEDKTSAMVPLSFEAGLAKIKTTNDPQVLLQLIAYNDRLRESSELDAVREASINAQDEVAKVRLEALGVSTIAAKPNRGPKEFKGLSANSWYICDRAGSISYGPVANDPAMIMSLGPEFARKFKTDELGNATVEGIDPNAQVWYSALNAPLQRFAAKAEQHSFVTQTFRSRSTVASLTFVRDSHQVHWAVTDPSGEDEKGAGEAPTVRDALEQAWDVLNKVLDKEPPPSDEIVEEVQQAADATDEAVQEAGGKAPTEKAAEDGKPITDPDEPVVDPADPQPAKGAPVDATGDATKKDLEAKPDAPVDDAKVDPADVKVDPDAKDDPSDPANDDTKVVSEDPPHADVKPKADDASVEGDAEAKPADSGLPPQTNDAGSGDVGATTSSPDSVVEQAEDQSMGDVLGLDPTKMETGERINMTYTLSDGSTGDVDVTFLREENDIFFFDGPKGEFGIGDRDGEWVDADGNSFAFAQGDAVEEITGDAAPDNGAVLEDIDLDAPADGPPTEHDDDSKPDFIKSKTEEKEAAPADDKAPAKDDSKGDDKDDSKDDDKKKSAPPWEKAKKSMLEENPGMSPAMAERLARRAASVAKTLVR